MHKFALHLFKSEDEDFKNDDDDVWTKKCVPIVEDGRHHCLRVVEYLGFTGCWLDFQIIQFVIKIAVSLEKMTVVPSNPRVTHCQLQSSKLRQGTLKLFELTID